MFNSLFQKASTVRRNAGGAVMNTYSKVSSSRRRAPTAFNKTTLALGISLVLCTGVAHAGLSPNTCTAIMTSTGNSNFTMLLEFGGQQGGTNDVNFTWNGTMYTNISDYSGITSVPNAWISSDETFSSNLWTAHNVQVFAQGSYTFDTALNGGNLEIGNITLNVGAGQLGMHMLFDWNGNTNIDVAVVLDKNVAFGSGEVTFPGSACTADGTNCLWNNGSIKIPSTSFLNNDPANRPLAGQKWMLTSVDGDGDGVPGIKMAPLGPFQGFNANFNFGPGGTLSPANGICGPATDITTDPLTFSPKEQKDAAFNTTFIADAMFKPPSLPSSTAISGLGVDEVPQNLNRTAAITISTSVSPTGSSGGNALYSINNGSYTNLPGTVKNGDTIKIKATSGTELGSTVTATLNIGGSPTSFFVRTPPKPNACASNFTMINAEGTVESDGANDVTIVSSDVEWNVNMLHNTTSTGMIFGLKLSSKTDYSGHPWSAHHIRVFEPSSTPYEFNTGCASQEIETNGGSSCVINGPKVKMTVGPGQLGAHMLFDWHTSSNIDVAVVWDKTKKFGPSPMFVGHGGDPETLWDLSSTDPDGDGKNGIPMVQGDGPFPGFNANFNLSFTPHACVGTVPIPMVAADTNVSKGVGCTLSTTPVNPLERGDWWLLLGFVAWMGGLVAKRKRA
jgi:hypothetical protein